MTVSLRGFAPYMLAGAAVAVAEEGQGFTWRGFIAMVIVFAALRWAEENGREGIE